MLSSKSIQHFLILSTICLDYVTNICPRSYLTEMFISKMQEIQSDHLE